MQTICAIAAVAIFIAGIFMFGNALKNGKIYDCIEESKTEKSWVFRDEDSRKFWSIFVCYFLCFSLVIFGLLWAAVGGELSS